jgi:catechol 2,3-dioxygenase-like lactoylglutathione lyase family enzyme
VIVGVHHVQITVPVGAEPAARRFYRDVLGLREIAKPAVLARRGGFWLEAGAFQVHVGVEDGVERHHTKSHVAFEVADLAAVRRLVAGAGLDVVDGEPVPGLQRFECRDPFGNRLEFVQRTPSS